MTTDAETTLADTFDDGSDSDHEDSNGGDDRQRLMRNNTIQSPADLQRERPDISRNMTQFPGSEAPVALEVPARPYNGGAPYTSFSHSNDGVFANLDAKPERGEKLEELPPVRDIGKRSEK